MPASWARSAPWPGLRRPRVCAPSERSRIEASDRPSSSSDRCDGARPARRLARLPVAVARARPRGERVADRRPEARAEEVDPLDEHLPVEPSARRRPGARPRTRRRRRGALSAPVRGRCASPASRRRAVTASRRRPASSRRRRRRGRRSRARSAPSPSRSAARTRRRAPRARRAAARRAGGAARRAVAGDRCEHLEVRVPDGVPRRAPQQQPVAERRERDERQAERGGRRLEAHRVTLVQSAWSWSWTRSRRGTDGATVAAAVTVLPAVLRRTRTAPRSVGAGLVLGAERERVIASRAGASRRGSAPTARTVAPDTSAALDDRRSIGFAGTNAAGRRTAVSPLAPPPEVGTQPRNGRNAVGRRAPPV